MQYWHERAIALRADNNRLRNELEAALTRTIAVTCRTCGIGYIEVPDSIDSGATFPCLKCRNPITFDVDHPDERAAAFRRLMRAKPDLELEVPFSADDREKGADQPAE